MKLLSDFLFERLKPEFYSRSKQDFFEDISTHANDVAIMKVVSEYIIKQDAMGNLTDNPVMQKGEAPRCFYSVPNLFHNIPAFIHATHTFAGGQVKYDLNVYYRNDVTADWDSTRIYNVDSKFITLMDSNDKPISQQLKEIWK